VPVPVVGGVDGPVELELELELGPDPKGEW